MKMIDGGNKKEEPFDTDMVADYFMGIPPKSEFEEKRQEREVDKCYDFVEKVKNYKFSN